MDKHTLDRIRSNDHRTLSRIISRIESNHNIPDEFFTELYDKNDQTFRIGITGPPGSGKSTLTDQLIQVFLEDNKSVGVVAVDPTSPFTGGALLGDRVRMNHYGFNENVFIRSMGSHGDLGGIARRAQDVGDILAASGKDVLIFETVGVGQGEHDVAKAVDLTLVLLVPESGDEIQLMKAGLIEIADLFVVNKSDRDGAGRLAQSLKSVLNGITQTRRMEPPVFCTSADRKDGIEPLYKGILDFRDLMEEKGILEQKRLERYKNRIFNLIQDRLLQKFWTQEKLDQMESAVQALNKTHTSPHEVTHSLLKDKRGER